MPVTPFLMSPEHAAELRALFTSAGYLSERVAERMGKAALPDIAALVGRPVPDDLGRDALGTLVRLFVYGRSADERTLRSLGGPEVELLEASGLLTGRNAGEGAAPTVLLLPVEDVWVASDLAGDPETGEGTELAFDAVYPALTRSGRRFLASFPRDPCERLLDLCGGSGVGALVAARTAKAAWSADVTERSTAFARFNAALNGLDNVTAVTGDLWEAVEGLTFDRIIAHPPYVPAASVDRIFRDGGPDGEHVTRRIVRQLPRFLEPGGSFHATCLLSDRGEALAEVRLRALLGDASESFDVVVGEIAAASARDHCTKLIEAGRLDFGEAGAEMRRLADLGVERVVVATLLLHRLSDGSGPPVTVRRRAGDTPAHRGLEILRRWARGTRRPELAERVLASRPRSRDEVRLVLAYHARDGQWVPTGDARVVNGSPLPASMEITGEVAHFLARCDGSRTAGELLAALRAGAMVPDDLPDDGFARIVWKLYGDGLLELDGEASSVPGASASSAGEEASSASAPSRSP